MKSSPPKSMKSIGPKSSKDYESKSQKISLNSEIQQRNLPKNRQKETTFKNKVEMFMKKTEFDVALDEKVLKKLDEISNYINIKSKKL